MTPYPSLSLEEISSELQDYEIALSEPALARLSTYLELLLRWNRRINLTGLRDPRLIVRRLFGESLYLSRVVELRGWLVDVGSGAGFPGLALKLIAPDLRVTLIESRQRKCAFLKEVVRGCGFYAVDVVCERFDAWAAQQKGRERVDCITTRAVEQSGRLLRTMAEAVRSDGGVVALFTTAGLSSAITLKANLFLWSGEHRIPPSKNAVILVGVRTVAS